MPCTLRSSLRRQAHQISPPGPSSGENQNFCLPYICASSAAVAHPVSQSTAVSLQAALHPSPVLCTFSPPCAPSQPPDSVMGILFCLMVLSPSFHPFLLLLPRLPICRFQSSISHCISLPELSALVFLCGEHKLDGSSGRGFSRVLVEEDMLTVSSSRRSYSCVYHPFFVSSQLPLPSDLTGMPWCLWACPWGTGSPTSRPR